MSFSLSGILSSSFSHKVKTEHHENGLKFSRPCNVLSIFPTPFLPYTSTGMLRQRSVDNQGGGLGFYWPTRLVCRPVGAKLFF